MQRSDSVLLLLFNVLRSVFNFSAEIYKYLPQHFELKISLGNKRPLLRVARTVAHLLCGLLEFIEVM